MRYFIISVFVLLLVSCKKKKTQEPEVLPDTYVDPTYYGLLESDLNINVGNNGPVDTTFRFEARLWEKFGNDYQYLGFKSFSYNNIDPLTVDNSNSFLRLANQSNWTLQSTQTGNFAYFNGASTPLISNAAGLIPSTFSGSEINIDLHDITNADIIRVKIFDASWLSEFSQTYEVGGRSNMQISFPVDGWARNEDMKITVSLLKLDKFSRDNMDANANKSTNYIYRSMKTS